MTCKCDCGNILTDDEIKTYGREGPCEECLADACNEGMSLVRDLTVAEGGN